MTEHKLEFNLYISKQELFYSNFKYIHSVSVPNKWNTIKSVKKYKENQRASEREREQFTHTQKLNDLNQTKVHNIQQVQRR